MFKTIIKVIFVNSLFLLTTLGLAQAANATKDKKVAPEVKEEMVTNLPVGITEVEQKLVYKKNDKMSFSLTGKGEGIRHKKVALFNVKVYQAQLFFEDAYATKTSTEELLASPTKGIKILPLRSFGGDKLKEALLISYEKNGINKDSEYQKGFLDLISANKVEKDQPVYLMGITNADKDELIITVKDQTKKVNGPKGFVNEVFKVWLGTPVDVDMVKLQDALTK